MAMKMDMDSVMGNLSVVSQTLRSDNIKMIDISDLIESKDNFFEMCNISELASAILGQGGVKDNLVVRPLDGGKYEIISGHRRKAAVQYLIDNGKKISSKLPCLVQNYEDEEAMKLDLILMNVTARQLTDAELMKSYEVLNEIFQKKKEKGEKFGKLREKLAEMLNVSPAQIGKVQNIERHAIPEVKEAVESGELSLSTANDISKLDEEEQKEIMNEKPASEIKPKDINKKKEKKEKEEKVDININFSEEDDTDVPEEAPSEKEDDDLMEFVKNNKDFLAASLSDYADMVDSEHDKDILSRFADMISKF